MIQNKHIIRLSFISLFLTIVANIVLYRYFMIEEVVIKQISEQNIKTAEIYKYKIWANSKGAISKLNNQDFKLLATDLEFIRFIQSSSQFFNEGNNNISLYDKNGKKFIESKPDEFLSIKINESYHWYDKFILNLDKYFLSSYPTPNPLLETLRGKTKHFLLARAIITDKEGTERGISSIISYIPIINSENGEFSVEGAIQITSDITDQWNNIAFLEKRIFLSFLTVFLVFFIIVMYNTNYAQ